MINYEKTKYLNLRLVNSKIKLADINIDFFTMYFKQILF